MNRRTFLAGAAVASLPVAAVAMPEPETLEQRRDRLFGELTETMQAMTGTRWRPSCQMKHGFLIVVNDYLPL